MSIRYIPRTNLEKYNAPRLVVPSMMAVAMKFRRDAVHRACRRPNLELNGPTSREPTKVPMVIREDMSCCTVGSMAYFLVASSK